MQTHGRELLLLILDSATGTKGWSAGTSRSVRHPGRIVLVYLLVVVVGFLCFLFIIFCSFFSLSPHPLITTRTLLKP